MSQGRSKRLNCPELKRQDLTADRSQAGPGNATVENQGQTSEAVLKGSDSARSPVLSQMTWVVLHPALASYMILGKVLSFLFRKLGLYVSTSQDFWEMTDSSVCKMLF